MATIGTIKLPLEKLHRVWGTDIDILDVVFDFKIHNIHKALTFMTNEAGTSSLILRSDYAECYGLLLRNPPPFLQDKDNPNYTLFIAPYRSMILTYFTSLSSNNRNLDERELLIRIVDYLKESMYKSPC